MTRSMKLTFLIIFTLIVSASLGYSARASAPASPQNSRVLVFVSDGMRMDLMKQFVHRGWMPTYAQILATGFRSVPGMIPNLPPNTGPGWTALATGAPPAINGVTNNTFHDNTMPFYPWGVSAWDPGINQAETIMQQAQQEGRTVAVLAWQAFDSATLADGSVFVESYPDWLTGRGIIANYDVPLQWTSILSPNYFLSKTVVTLVDASGWSDVPDSFSPAQETTLSIPSFYGPVLGYNVYIFDSTDDAAINYDQVLVSPSKDGDDTVAVMGAQGWSETVDVSIYGINGGFYMKVVDLEPDLSQFRLYFTPATRYRAFPQDLEDYLVANYEAFRPSDYAPYILGLIDDETFMEQHLFSEELLGQQVFPYIIRTYQPDLVLAGNEATDSVTHRFLSRTKPGSPVYEPANAGRYKQYIADAYMGADAALRALWNEMPGANVIVTSDHGFQDTWMAINANYILQTIGLFIPGDYTNSQAVAYVAGGTAQIYINLAGRNPGGVVPPEDYELVRQQIVDAFNSLGPGVIDRVLIKEDTDDIPTTQGVTVNLLHPDRTGDVVVFSKPPYQFDAPTPGMVTALTPIYGQHGFIPNGAPDRFGVFAAAGPQVRYGKYVPITAFDVAPTIAALLGISPPDQSIGRALPLMSGQMSLKTR